MINSRLSQFIPSNPKGIGYLIKIINILPPKFWNNAKDGGGLVNKILNMKGMPELHIPGYSYCGPFTKLDERLERGDKGINKLDEACKQHDIAYRDNKDIQLRHEADKILEDEAWKRMFSNDSSIGEKISAFGVGTLMNTKVKLGLGF
jgi:hypothetical protein